MHYKHKGYGNDRKKNGFKKSVSRHRREGKKNQNNVKHRAVKKIF